MTTAPLTEQQLDEYAQLIARTTPHGAAVASPGMGAALLAEVNRLRAELEERTQALVDTDALRERHKASLRRADKANNELMEEVQRYAEGKERPVLWSVYNDMHLRAANAELALDRVRRIVSRLAAHAVGFQDVLDESDRGPWGRPVGADIAELAAALSPDTAPTPAPAPLAASHSPAGDRDGETGTEGAAGHEGDSGAQHITLTRSDLAVLLAHHADVLAARWRAVAPGAGAWEIAAALSLTSHANELSAETERPAVTELLDNIWTFPLEQQAPAEETAR